MNPHTPQSVAPAGQYLTVILAEEFYGLAVSQVREIIRLQKITPIPQLPDFFKGVINLRGRVVPVVDLRLRFGLAAVITDRTCIVVAQVRGTGNAAMPLGLIVDAVEDVMNLTEANLEPTPEFGMQVDTSCLLGLAKVKGEVKMLLDVDHVIAGAALAAFQ